MQRPSEAFLEDSRGLHHLPYKITLDFWGQKDFSGGILCFFFFFPVVEVDVIR